MGKIISQAGSQKIPVGQIIAVLAEEGDDLSTLEVPGDLSPPSSASTSGLQEPASEPEKSETEKKELASTPRHDTPSESPHTQTSSSSPKSGTPTPDGQRQNAPQAGRKTEEKAEKIQLGGVPVDVGGHKGNVHGGASGRPLFPSVMRL
jgi:pyruvate/2-oxoglutarate dehydrogenase complex dihydrolipoamide acyltransferase (E2) component